MSGERINIITLKATGLVTSDLAEMARLDNKVFCGKPWFEGVFCDECSAMKFPTVEAKDAEECKICGDPIISIDLRIKKVTDELLMNRAFVALAKNKIEKVVGFAFGYVCNSPEEFVTDKYRDLETQESVKSAIKNFGINGEFFYFSGIGIDFEYRGLKIANRLGEEIDNYAKSEALPGITRTLWDSPIVSVEKRLGFEIIVGPDILPLADRENSRRVLLARR